MKLLIVFLLFSISFLLFAGGRATYSIRNISYGSNYSNSWTSSSTTEDCTYIETCRTWSSNDCYYCNWWCPTCTYPLSGIDPDWNRKQFNVIDLVYPNKDRNTGNNNGTASNCKDTLCPPTCCAYDRRGRCLGLCYSCAKSCPTSSPQTYNSIHMSLSGNCIFPRGRDKLLVNSQVTCRWTDTRFSEYCSEVKKRRCGGTDCWGRTRSCTPIVIP